MKKTKLKLIPPLIMLVAGSIASIMTYYFQYEIKAALLILLSVLLIFYIVGLILVKVIRSFDEKNEQIRLEEEQRALEEEVLLEGRAEEEIFDEDEMERARTDADESGNIPQDEKAEASH